MRSLLVVLLFALAARAGYLWNYRHTHARQALAAVPFLLEPGNIAFSLVNGKGFSSPLRVESGPTAWMTPVYPLLLAAIFRIFGTYTFHAYEGAATLNLLFSAATTVAIYFVGRRMAGARVGLGAAWIWALFPNAWIIPVETMWDASLSALVVALILWATLYVMDSRRTLEWCGYGLLWGAALMINATLLAVLPLVLPWMAYRARAVRGAMLAAGVALLCCVPWTVRNAVALHAFVPLRSVMGVSLWLGTIDPALGRAPRSFHPIADQAERARFVELGELAYMREKQRLAINFIVAHPVTEARLSAQRFVALWAGGSMNPVHDFLENRSAWFRWVLGFNVVLALTAAMGMARLLWVRNALAIPAVLFVVVVPVAYYLTLASARYRHPIDPALVLLAAAAFIPKASATNS